MPGLMVRLPLLMMLSFILMLSMARAEPVTPGTQQARQYVTRVGRGDDAREVTVRYWIFVPRAYAETKQVPLMLFLHGAGERGDDLELVKKWGPPKRVAKQEDFPFLLISPQCEKGERWELALEVLKDYKSWMAMDTICYSAAISACEKGNQWRHALALLQTMCDERV